MMDKENELINKVIEGDRYSAARLVDNHRKFVFTTAYRALGNADDAQDVAQEALVYALQRLPELRDRTRLSPWLRQITLTLCADYRRRRGTRRLGEPMTILNEASEETNYVERLAIRQAVATLSDAHRTTLLLHYEGGWSLEETAGLLDIPVNTVRSRLMAAKRGLRNGLPIELTREKRMPVKSITIANDIRAALDAAFPGSRLLSVQNDPEPWMPFTPRVRLETANGTRTVDIRRDINPGHVDLLTALHTAGVHGPSIVHGPVSDGDGGFITVCEPPKGENLLLWALGGTPHRIRVATERAFEAIDRLQASTSAIVDAGIDLPRKTLADEAAALASTNSAWLSDPWFASALKQVSITVADIDDPLVLTNYLHFFPNWVRVKTTDSLYKDDEPLGWPGDERLGANPIVEFVSPWGHLGDPLLGLAMVWIYDCYPFVHTGFVEQYLWRKGVGKREFGPRLALRALQTLAREVPADRPVEGHSYWDALRGYVDQGLSWM